jgi:hypothetical protein
VNCHNVYACSVRPRLIDKAHCSTRAWHTVINTIPKCTVARTFYRSLDPATTRAMVCLPLSFQFSAVLTTDTATPQTCRASAKIHREETAAVEARKREQHFRRARGGNQGGLLPLLAVSRRLRRQRRCHPHTIFTQGARCAGLSCFVCHRAAGAC